MEHKRRDGFRARLAARGSGYIRRWSTNVVMVLELDWQLEALAILEDGDKHKRRDGFRARLAARGSGYIRRWRQAQTS